MPIDTIALEKAIKRAIPVTHLEIEDQSSGCGDNYAIVLVSEVRLLYSDILGRIISREIMYGFSRPSKGRQRLLVIAWVSILFHIFTAPGRTESLIKTFSSERVTQGPDRSNARILTG